MSGKKRFWYTIHRPASYNPSIAIGEKKSLVAQNLQEARNAVERMRPDIIDGVEYKRTLLQPRF